MDSYGVNNTQVCISWYSFLDWGGQLILDCVLVLKMIGSCPMGSHQKKRVKKLHNKCELSPKNGEPPPPPPISQQF